MSTEMQISTDTDALRRTNEPSVDTGQATAGAAATITDTSKTWMVNEWATRVIEITEGTGKGQFRNIVSNTATVLTVAPAWTVIPDTSSYYRIGLNTGTGGGGTILDSGISTGGAVGNLVDALKNWDVGIWEGKLLKILSGANEGAIRKIISNTATQVNVGVVFGAAIVAGVNYAILDDNACGEDVRRSATSILVPLAKQTEEGIATAGAANSLTDGAKFWDVNMWAGHYVRIASGTGFNQIRFVASNTLNVLTVITAWAANPDATSKYIIFSLPTSDAGIGIDYGIATNNALANMQDATKFWDVDMYEGKLIKFLTGPAAGCVRRIQGNDINNIYPLNNFSAACGVGSRYVIFDDVGILPDIIQGTPVLSRLVPLAKQMEEGLVTTAGVGVVTVTDANKNLALNCYTGYGLRVVSGTGAGSVRRIGSNTAGAGTVYTCDTVLTTGLDSKYVIFQFPVASTTGMPSENIASVGGTAQTAADWTQLFQLDFGAATAGAANSITDGVKLWEPDSLIGCIARVISGTGINQNRLIVSNTATVITIQTAWTNNPIATDKYVIYAVKPGVATQTYNTPGAGAAVITIFTARIAHYSTRIVGQVYADVASAANGLSIEQSYDGISWDYMTQYSVLAGVVLPFSVDIVGKYVRVVYTNGQGAQATFRTSVSLKV